MNIAILVSATIFIVLQTMATVGIVAFLIMLSAHVDDNYLKLRRKLFNMERGMAVGAEDSGENFSRIIRLETRLKNLEDRYEDSRTP